LGSVVNVNNPSQFVTITSVTWTVTDGTRTATYSAATTPPTRIVTIGGQSLYVLEVPFDTRTFGSVSLSDPATIGISSFELKAASPPTYFLTPTINGVVASLRAVDGAPASGNNYPVAGFSAAARGRAIRVDLAINPPTDPYETWAIGYFGSATVADAARTADPDRDGLNNLSEYLAGTNPTNAMSSLRILTISTRAAQNQVTIDWASVSSKNYRLETASAVYGPWTDAGLQVTGAGDTAQASIGRSPANEKMFYRVRLVP
jgi:hypothetical protein